MQTKPIPHPLFVGLTWGVLMCLVALIFLTVQHLAGTQSGALIAGDQWLSLGLFLSISFTAGFSVAWLRRRGQSKPAGHSPTA